MLATSLCLTFLTLVFCILDLSREFYNPFGQDPINFPVLTWVASAAAESLTVVTESDDTLEVSLTASSILPPCVLRTVPGAGMPDDPKPPHAATAAHAAVGRGAAADRAVAGALDHPGSAAARKAMRWKRADKGGQPSGHPDAVAPPSIVERARGSSPRLAGATEHASSTS